MVTSAVIRRVKKLDKVLQVRLPHGTEQRLALMAKTTGLDKSALARMALNWTAPLRLESFHRDLREGRPAVFVVD